MAIKILSIVLILGMVASSASVEYFDKFQALRNALRQTFASARTDQKQPSNDRGVVTNCLGTPGPPFSIEWDPKIVNPEGRITIYYDYTIPFDFKSGTADAQLYYAGSSIFQDTLPVDCHVIGKYVECPLKKGKRLKGTYPYSDLLFLKGYDGTYTAVLKLKNDKNEVMMCANATVTISGKGWY